MIYTVGKRILAIPFEWKTQPKGSLLLSCPKDYITAKVLCRGDLVTYEIQDSDIIIVAWNCARKIEISGEDYLLFFQDDILALWREEKTLSSVDR